MWWVQVAAVRKCCWRLFWRIGALVSLRFVDGTDCSCVSLSSCRCVSGDTGTAAYVFLCFSQWWFVTFGNRCVRDPERETALFSFPTLPPCVSFVFVISSPPFHFLVTSSHHDSFFFPSRLTSPTPCSPTISFLSLSFIPSSLTTFYFTTSSSSFLHYSLTSFCASFLSISVCVAAALI